MLRWGYVTNGLPDHDWRVVLRMLAEAGYQSVALTVDHHTLNPAGRGFADELRELKDLLLETGLGCVIETGARFLLDPWRKHWPTLLEVDPAIAQRRLDFLRRCCDLAIEVGAGAVSFWSGQLPEDTTREAAFDRLLGACQTLVRQVGGGDHARSAPLKLAFEPEPGMLIERTAQADPLLAATPADIFGLTIDIGHLHCLGEVPIADVLTRYRKRLFNIHIEDMLPGVHEHLRLGEGSIEFRPVLECLHQIGYTGGIHVELSRHGHLAPTVLQESIAFLRQHAP